MGKTALKNAQSPDTIAAYCPAASFMKTAHVIGLGRSGIAAARVLARQGWNVTLSDSGAALRHQSDATRLREEGITIKLNHAFKPEPGLDLLVVSPGVPWDASALVEARRRGIETIGEMELAWRSLSDRPWLGITGTNGKTTTTALVAAIFKAAGINGSRLWQHWLCRLRTRPQRAARLGNRRTQQLPNRSFFLPSSDHRTVDNLYPRPSQPPQNGRELLPH